MNGTDSQISAAPTKAFFIDMLTRDISLEQAVLDLVDNSVDGARRFGAFADRSVRISFNDSRFRILDNCGGFGRAAARDYAFRFGRPLEAVETPNSIGQFGIGMKRVLFKFGRRFRVRSATADEQWAIDVDVERWERTEDWHFAWAEFALKSQ
jgi:DNA topoisomerase VI subunit B